MTSKRRYGPSRVEARKWSYFCLVHFFASHTEQIAATAIELRLPTMIWFRGYVQGGGLMSYGADVVEMYRQAAVHVSNLKTAKALGIELPTGILPRADEVIE